MHVCLDKVISLQKSRSSETHHLVLQTQWMGRMRTLLVISKDIYKDLYNSVEDSTELIELCDTVNRKENVSCLNDVKKVTPDVISEAAKNLRDSKSDPCYSFSSDCIKNGPDSTSSP